MIKDWDPPFIGGFDKLIPVHSPYYIDISANMNIVRFDAYIYCWNGSRTATTPRPPIRKISKEILNEMSRSFNISDYLKPYVNPVIYDLTDVYDYDDNTKWVCYKVITYDVNDNVVNIDNSDMYVATYGYKWSTDSRFSDPRYDSNGKLNEHFTDDLTYKTHYNLPIPLNSLNVVYEWNLLPSVVDSSNIIDRFVSNNLNNTDCKTEYEICFINRQGIWEWFPLTGKVVVNTSVSKSTYKRHNFKSNYETRFMNHGFFNEKAVKKYNWTSSSLPDDFFIIYEEIIHSPMIVLYNVETYQFEFVDILNSNYAHLHHANNKSMMSYNVEFTAQNDKIKKI